MARPSEVSFFQVDAFTERPFRGNAAGVFVLEEAMDPRAMHLLARETNLSETAFVSPPDEDGVREVRWFTPAVEVSLCGHATLAVGHVIVNELGGSAPVRLESAAGPISVRLGDGLFSISVAADPPTIALPPSGLLRALRCHEAVPVLRARQVWVVRLSWPKEVEALTPNIPELLEVDPGEGVLGVAVTAPAIEEVDFVSRFFAPWVGVPEDPVTGVAHTALAPYWAKQLDRTQLVGRQLSTREGNVQVHVVGNEVILSGRAVTVARGAFLLPRLAELQTVGR
jgi:PhzF family phenazine biosynthesis protein